MLTGCPTFNLLIEEIVQEQKDLEKLWKKLKQFVVDKKYIVVALSKIQENIDNVSESDDNTLTLPNYGYTIIDVKNKYDSIFIFFNTLELKFTFVRFVHSLNISRCNSLI